MRSKFGIPEEVNGVLVVNVKSETDASEKGILPGDIIIEISQNKVFTPDDVSMRVLEEINAERDFALMLINRKGILSYIAVKISKN
jgi:serine protease Do